MGMSCFTPVGQVHVSNANETPREPEFRVWKRVVYLLPVSVYAHKKNKRLESIAMNLSK